MAFLRAIGAIQRLSGRCRARTWLLAIARRVVADRVRHARSLPCVDPEQLLNPNRPDRGFEDLVEVTTMIASLTTDQREALLLTQLLGLSYADAAGCAASRWAPSDPASPAPAMRCWNATT